jgi:hypothetical protein
LNEIIIAFNITFYVTNGKGKYLFTILQKLFQFSTALLSSHCGHTSCAFFNLAAATIFMALVICRVEATDAIRVRISFMFAIYQFLI